MRKCEFKNLGCLKCQWGNCSLLSCSSHFIFTLFVLHIFCLQQKWNVFRHPRATSITACHCLLGNNYLKSVSWFGERPKAQRWCDKRSSPVACFHSSSPFLKTSKRKKQEYYIFTLLNESNVSYTQYVVTKDEKLKELRLLNKNILHWKNKYDNMMILNM